MPSEKAKEFNESLKTKEGRDKFFKQIFCIAIGTVVGVATYAFCLYFNLAIFGWNIGLALSPLTAGYAESILAKKILNESTGAISAFILFIITVVYGFFISNSTLGFNIITAGSAVVIIQAAMPTATNYFLLAVGVGILTGIAGLMKKIHTAIYKGYKKIFKREPKRAEKYYQKQASQVHAFYDEKLDINSLGVLIMTLEYPPKELNIIEQKGIYETRHIFGSKQKEDIKSGLEDSLEEEVINRVKLARDKTLVKLIKEVKADGCNGLMHLHTTYETLGTEKGEHVAQVVMRGTGIVIEKEEEEY